MLRRIAAILLTVMMFSALLPAVCSAWGADDRRLIITHINTQNTTEGSAIIIDGEKYKTLGQRGKFNWWSVYLFDWDAKEKCYVLTESYTDANNKDKSQVAIPETGFAWCVCIGNDYSASGGINYITDRIKQSAEYAKSLKKGEKAYLYGTSLKYTQILNNGKQWYEPDYESKSYIKLGEPEKDGEAYDPAAPEKSLARLEINCNHVNSDHYENGDCILFTPEYGTALKGAHDYAWWDVLVFGPDRQQQCYVCRAVDQVKGNGYGKTPIIPADGFVIADCYSPSANAVASCQPGTKAWLYMNDDGTATVSLNRPDDKGKAKIPEGKQLDAPLPEGMDKYGRIICGEKAFEFKWKPVEGADGYLVSVNLSTINTFGQPVTEPTRVNDASISFDAGTLEPGKTYTVCIQAVSGDGTSLPVFCKLSCLRESALRSSLNGRRIVAFGDSLTARPGWVSMLPGYIGADVINAGVGGDSTVNAVARFEADVLDKKPEITLVCFGMNDQAEKLSESRPNIPLEKYIENMSGIIERLKKAGSDVVLICPHSPYAADGYYKPGEYDLDYAHGNMKQFCEAVRQLAARYGCDFIDIYAETANANMSEFLNAGDGIHQSVKGHEKWAEYVGKYLLAKYDGTDRALVRIECRDENGTLIKECEFIAAAGSTMTLPVPEIDGMKSNDEEQTVKVKGDMTVTYTYGKALNGENGKMSNETKSSESTVSDAERELEARCADKYERITKRLIEKKMTITAMESCTSGAIASLITDTEGASAVLGSSFVTYSNSAKVKAGVAGKIIKKFGVYSAETAEYMAATVRNVMNADIGIGVTGSLGNTDPNNPDSVPGEVWFAIDFRGQIHPYFIKGIPFEKRHYAKLYVAERVADELLKLL